MPVDRKKYFYINRVGLLLDSPTHQRLLQDAEDSHMPEQHGKLVAMRLAEYYRLQDRINQLFTYNPALAAMLLSVGGTSDKPVQEVRLPSPSVAHHNGSRKPAEEPLLSKVREEEKAAKYEEATTEQEEFTDSMLDEWDM